jgi:hypothetical protein
MYLARRTRRERRTRRKGRETWGSGGGDDNRAVIFVSRFRLSFKTSVSLLSLRVLRAMFPSMRCSLWGRGLGGYEAHLLELSEESEQHLLGIDPLVEPETSSFSRVSHDVVAEIEDCLSERP